MKSEGDLQSIREPLNHSPSRNVYDGTKQENP